MAMLMPFLLALVTLGAGDAAAASREPAPDRWTDERAAMVRDQIKARGVADERVLDAMRDVPRHEFVPADQRRDAYDDTPLPIGEGQTISQPYIVAAMTELLELGSDSSVLEIGTGSGYQAAVAARLAKHVYTLEIRPALADQAASRLRQLKVDNVTVRAADGYFGWSARAPYDGILVTAAASHIPPALVQQLKPGGRMVIPVGSPYTVQRLMLVTKDKAGAVSTRNLFPVRFVPLTGGH